MRLAALLIGAGVPDGDFSAVVAEVHARACLLAAADGALVTLAAAELGGLPRGVTLDTRPGFAFRDMLTAGVPAARRGGVLRTGDGALAVDLRTARQWRSELCALRLDLGQTAVRMAWHAAGATLTADGRAAGLLRLAENAIATLGAASRARDAAAAGRAMARMVGLGAGRTPSGDDYLVGYLAGLSASGDDDGRLGTFAAALRAEVPALAARTTNVSRLYLEAAATGEVSQRLRDVAAVIAAGTGRIAVGRAVAAALAIGHDSGAAGVLGLLHGCAAGRAIAPGAAYASAESGARPAPARASRHATARQITPRKA